MAIVFIMVWCFFVGIAVMGLSIMSITNPQGEIHGYFGFFGYLFMIVSLIYTPFACLALSALLQAPHH